jgi:dihydrofolate synthase/folylpolyglutamate synthase
MSALDDILAREFFGVKLGLDPMRALCAALGDPERAAPTLIVAGTNGKGSVSAMTARALAAAGYRAARYTSPHLVSLTERFVVEDRPLGLAAIEEAAAVVLAAEAGGRRSGAIAGPMTFFELTTATAFVAFARAGAEVTVVEVGLGGRLDATNVVAPVAAAITSIDFDHTEHLGHTLAAIAREKAGVMRPGVPVVTGVTAGEPLQAIREAAAALGAPLIEAARDTEARWALDADGRTHLGLRTPRRAYGPVVLALRGAHQVQNAAVAVRLLEAAVLPRPPASGGDAVEPVEAPAGGWRVGASAIVEGLERASWPGRLDLRALPDGRSVLLDAAHNLAGARSLAAYLQLAGMAPLPVVFGVVRDKDCAGMLTALAPAASRFVFTQASTPRARPAAEIADLARAVGLRVPMAAAGSPLDALSAAWSHGDRICVSGSIFLVGDVLAHLPPGGPAGRDPRA